MRLLSPRSAPRISQLLPSWETIFTLMLAGSSHIAAISLSLDDPASIKKAASTIAADMMRQYTGNNAGDVPGNLPAPYYWWECGAMFGAMINYWYFTGDDTYNAIVTQGMMHQVGPDDNYMPPNQSSTLGNDDQAFWGMAAMAAAELKFPDPPIDQPQWLELAQAVFNGQTRRWDTAHCNGGLRWQIYSFNNGYNYKNTVSNGAFFNLAARLAKYTGNSTYSDWATKAWEWTTEVGLMSPAYNVWDGTDILKNCVDQNRDQWSYNNGIYLLGAANMYNIKTNGSTEWRERVMGMVNASAVFFQDGIMREGCEIGDMCHTDSFSFKAYLARWMTATTQMAPFTYDLLMPNLRTSATAAAQQCSGGASGNSCGTKWTQKSVYDGVTGVGQQMSALEVIQGQLISQVAAPVTDMTGGTSKGNPNAGTVDSSNVYGLPTTKITRVDRVGAGILTTISCLMVMCGTWLMLA